MYSADYNQILKEYFDITDTKTRKIMLAINEADQNAVLSSLTTKLYGHIVDKVDDIDFGDIPKTKGDITKLESYEKLVDCVKTIHGILDEYKQSADSIITIEKAINNVLVRKDMFEKAFRYEIELPIVLYSTIVLAIVSATSFMIASSIEYIKTPSDETFDTMIDKVSLVRTKDHLLFDNLKKFNVACDKGQIDSCVNAFIKANAKNFTGTTIAVGSIALVGLLLTIIPIIRELIFFFYYSRTRISDYFDMQSDLLTMNAYNVKNNTTMDKYKRDKIAKKQLSIAKRFRTIANKVQVTSKKAEIDTTKEIQKETKKVKTDELIDTVPDSASSVLF